MSENESGAAACPLRTRLRPREGAVWTAGSDGLLFRAEETRASGHWQPFGGLPRGMSEARLIITAVILRSKDSASAS